MGGRQPEMGGGSREGWGGCSGDAEGRGGGPAVGRGDPCGGPGRAGAGLVRRLAGVVREAAGPAPQGRSEHSKQPPHGRRLLGEPRTARPHSRFPRLPQRRERGRGCAEAPGAGASPHRPPQPRGAPGGEPPSRPVSVPVPPACPGAGHPQPPLPPAPRRFCPAPAPAPGPGRPAVPLVGADAGASPWLAPPSPSSQSVRLFSMAPVPRPLAAAGAGALAPQQPRPRAAPRAGGRGLQCGGARAHGSRLLPAEPSPAARFITYAGGIAPAAAGRGGRGGAGGAQRRASGAGPPPGCARRGGELGQRCGPGWRGRDGTGRPRNRTDPAPAPAPAPNPPPAPALRTGPASAASPRIPRQLPHRTPAQPRDLAHTRGVQWGRTCACGTGTSPEALGARDQGPRGPCPASGGSKVGAAPGWAAPRHSGDPSAGSRAPAVDGDLCPSSRTTQGTRGGRGRPDHPTVGLGG